MEHTGFLNGILHVVMMTLIFHDWSKVEIWFYNGRCKQIIFHWKLFSVWYTKTNL